MSSEKKRLVSLTFPPDLVQFIDELSWKILKQSKSQRKLSRADLLRGLLTVFREAKFDLTGIESQEEFVESILSEIASRRRKRRKGKK